MHCAGEKQYWDQSSALYVQGGEVAVNENVDAVRGTSRHNARTLPVDLGIVPWSVVVASEIVGFTNPI